MPSQLRNANFGPAKANLTGSSGVGYTLYSYDGSVSQARTTSGVYQIVSGSGIYVAYISFPNDFHGTILWDSGESDKVYAVEHYNTEENDPRVYSQLTATSESVNFLVDMEGGKWKIENNQMKFYKSDNTTLVAVFDLYDSGGGRSSINVHERRRVD